MSTSRATTAAISWALRCDVREMAEILSEGLGHPVSPTDIDKERHTEGNIGMKATVGRRMAACFIYHFGKNEIELLRLAVRSDFRRLGIGRQIIDRLKEKVHAKAERERLVLKCRESNMAACYFYRECGLRAAGVVRDWYEHPREDAYVFEYRPVKEAA